MKKVKGLVSQSHSILCDPMDCSPPGSSVHGILPARVLEWVAIPFSRDLPSPGIKPGSPALQADSLPSEAPGKPHMSCYIQKFTNTLQKIHASKMKLQS